MVRDADSFSVCPSRCKDVPTHGDHSARRLCRGVVVRPTASWSGTTAYIFELGQ